MKYIKKELLFLSMTLLLTACSHDTKPQEKYDAVSVSYYTNTYDDKGRLSYVQMEEMNYLYYGEDKSQAYIMTSNSSRQYIYQNDTDYLATEFSESDIRTTSYIGNTEEELWLQDGKDTVHYCFTKYHDKDKPEYTKNISKSKDKPSEDWRSESYFTYDKDNNLIKVIDNDLKTGERTERYNFIGITYNEARQKVPQSEHKQEIECKTVKTDKDTLITQITVNGLLSEIQKKYAAGELLVETSDRKTEKSHWIDSTFYKNGKIIRKSRIDSNGESIIIATSMYDEKENLVKETNKYRMFTIRT